jgi:hypothetical protein
MPQDAEEMAERNAIMPFIVVSYHLMSAPDWNFYSRKMYFFYFYLFLATDWMEQHCFKPGPFPG